MNGRFLWRSAVPDIVFAVTAVALAAWSFWPIYQSAAFVRMLVVALVLGCAIGVLGAVFRLPSIVIAGLVVGGYLGTGAQLAVPGQVTAGGFLPTAQGFVDLLQGTWLSWKQLVTISVPVGSYQALLVPAFILVLLAAVLTTTVALRSSLPECGAIPPIVLLIAGIACGGVSASTPLWLVFGLSALLVVWNIRFRLRRRTMAVRTLREQSGLTVETRLERGRTVALTATGAAVMLVGAAVVGIGASALVPPTADRQVVRTAVEQPFDPRTYPSPLSGFRSYVEPASAALPMLSVSGLPADGRIRIATLDSYDGVTYSVGSGEVMSASGSFTRLPYRLDQSGTAGTRTEMMVTVHGYRGPWVPGSGRLEQIQFFGADASTLSSSYFYNDVTGAGAVMTDLHDGDTYRATSVTLPTFAVAQLAKREPGSDTAPPATVVPEELQSTLQKYTAGVTGAGAKLTAALEGLANDGYMSHGVGEEEPASRSGHGADRITELLTAVPMLGDQEQYAVTAALMARQLGFPARVVMGFVAPASVSREPITVWGSDISAWIEVQTTSGWVTVDPTPPVRPVPPKQPEQPTEISRPQTKVHLPLEENPQNDEPSQAQVDSMPESASNPVLEIVLAVVVVIGWTLLVLAVIAAPFLAVIAAKWRRRALRRSAPTPAERIIGGWREFADAAADHGYDPPPAATRPEFATAIGGSRAAALAMVADRAVFGPMSPNSAEADTVWKVVDDLRGQLDRRDTRWKRLRAALSLRSFGYRGRTGTKGVTR